MEIVTAFAVVPGPENWSMEDGKVEIHEGEEGSSDFVIGTFSCLEKAKHGVKEFLASYKVGDDDQFDRIDQNDPILKVCYWRTVLDEGGAKGENLHLETEEFDYG